MTVIKGRPVVRGKGTGPALVTRMPINFTAAFTKPVNLLPWKKSAIMDAHHELYNKPVKGMVLVFPACIGSTYTGMMLMQLMYDRVAPAAMVVQNADSLLTSGAVLGDVWFDRGVPIVEYESDDIFEKIRNGAQVEVDGVTGEIKLR
jgi:predicted aconitase with swiveling domain